MDTWKQFKEALNAEFYPPTKREFKTLEFDRLTQRTIYIVDYKKKFKELSQFGLFMI